MDIYIYISKDMKKYFYHCQILFSTKILVENWNVEWEQIILSSTDYFQCYYLLFQYFLSQQMLSALPYLLKIKNVIKL